MRQVLAILLIAVVAIGLSIALSPKRELRNYSVDEPAASTKSKQQPAKPKADPSEDWNAPREGVVTVTMTIKDRGDIVMELYPKAAPKSVAEFLRLNKTGYYNNLKFHRVRKDFMVQVGDPVTKSMTAAELEPLTDENSGPNQVGTHGTGTPIPFEASGLQNVVGSVAFALKSARSDTADGQFFINTVSNHFLDGDYCVFGKVIKGMEVVNKIKQGDEITQSIVK